ncbi:hypothetical protein RFZ44_05225, partial [Acinetobacter sp. 163]|nr:hypothetical protein [Acinetobacter sp. 163]
LLFLLYYYTFPQNPQGNPDNFLLTPSLFHVKVDPVNAMKRNSKFMMSIQRAAGWCKAVTNPD